MDKQEKEKGKQWKNELFNGALELALLLVVGVIAFLLAILIPREVAIPFELLLLLALVLVFLFVGVVWVLRCLLKKKK